LVELVVDREGSTGKTELGATWGRNIVTGFARLDGRAVAAFTSDYKFNGGMV